MCLLLFCLLFSIVYKITDFGSSRELLGEDRSKALYGTEEYLVSDVVSDNCMYFLVDKSVFILLFLLSIDLWIVITDLIL